MAVLSLRGIGKDFGAQQILKSIDLEVPDGAFVVLVGPSGCGKSTLLRVIAGLEEATRGDILLDGKRINQVDAADRDMAMVFQSYALYPHMTNAENMAFHMRLSGVARDEREARVQRAAGILGITPLLGRKPADLSGGQRQRVAMGRAIVREPKIFLFDEPLSNLDAQLRMELRTEIKALHQRIGTTTVYVTHDQIEAMTLADLIVVMRDGVIEQMGRPLDIFDAPANRFVARFIGSPPMNLLEGGIQAEAGGPVFVADPIRIPLDPARAGLAGRRVQLGIRPGSFSLGGDIAAVVEVVEMTGLETLIHASAGPHRIHAVLPGRHDPAPGSPIRLGVEAQALHLFDAGSGVRL